MGRAAEWGEVEGLLARARGGMSGALLVRGEAGVGKTCLLDAAVASATDFDVVRVVGIESEMQLGFAGVHQLLTPFVDRIEQLPSPQARALRSAFGLSDEAPPDRFFVGLGALTLISGAATERPLLVVIDDAQWLDQDSAGALGILGRRLHADRVCVLMAVREPFDDHHLVGLPTLTLSALSEPASDELLSTVVTSKLADDVRLRLLADAGGIPLALIEFARQLSPDQLAGAEQLPPALPVGGRLEAAFVRQLDAVPPPTRRLLLVAAAEPTGDASNVLRAGHELDYDEAAIAPAQLAGLLERGPGVVFRHPLVRSAAYHSATIADRCRAHAALAAVTDLEEDADRRAWHRAAAAQFPDDDVAAELERAAQRAGLRGSSSTSAALFRRAAELTLDTQQRALRLFGAAAADFAGGNAQRADATLARAVPDLHGPFLAGSAQRLDGVIAFLRSDGHDSTSVSKLVDAAQTLATVDVGVARDAMLDILPMAITFGASSPVSLVDIADIARSFELPVGTTPTAADLLLDALVVLFTEPLASSIPVVQRALTAIREDPELRNTPRHLARACYLPQALSDDESHFALASACATACRAQGSFQGLNEALAYLFIRELRVGSIDRAADLVLEQRELRAVVGHPSGLTDVQDLIVSAWRGRETDVRTKAPDLDTVAPPSGYLSRLITHARIVLEVGLGNYDAAASLVRDDWYQDFALGALRAADATEAQVRSGDVAAALTSAAFLRERASATESPFDRGLWRRSEALLADGSDAETSFRDSITDLQTCGAHLHVARSQLVYGEWFCRQKRRRDAREVLETARESFEAMGAQAFAERARVELLATGANARRRVDETRQVLTPQESQIARLAGGGFTNPEIAERLFISANTVDYHLRKVYRKLDIGSRHEIAAALDDRRIERDDAPANLTIAPQIVS